MHTLMVVTILLELLLCGTLAQAVQIQYLLSTGDVTGVLDVIEPIDGYGLLDFPGHEPSEIIWPVPAGCTVGQKQWTRIVNPAAATIDGGGMAVRSEQAFFHTTSPLLTGCHPVDNKRALKRLVDETIIASAVELNLVQAIGAYNSWLYASCLDQQTDPDLNFPYLTWSTNANCITWKANMAEVNGKLPGRGQGVTSSNDLKILVLDQDAFVAAQCAAQPGGPWC